MAVSRVPALRASGPALRVSSLFSMRRRRWSSGVAGRPKSLSALRMLSPSPAPGPAPPRGLAGARLRLTLGLGHWVSRAASSSGDGDACGAAGT